MNKTVEEMSIFELSRWFSLFEAINIIGDECDDRGKNFEKQKLSPLSLEKYVEGTCDIYARKLIEEMVLDDKSLNVDSLSMVEFNTKKL